MKKLISSNLELDLSNYAITTTDENSWFADSFSSKITYPFEIQLTDELDIAFGFISRTSSVPTLFDVKYHEDDKIHDAQFEITGEEGGVIQASYEYGLEEFPLWETKLSELPLENFVLEFETMYTHAINRVNKVWPEVNYTFPAIHASQFKDDAELWEYFEGVINNYQNGEFLINEFDVEEVISYNRNVMQPLVSLMYLMTIIAQTAGYNLAGDILTDINLQDNFVFSPKEYFKKREPIELYAARLASNPSTSEDIVGSPGYKYSTFELNLTLPKLGKYNISGVFRVRKYNYTGGTSHTRHMKISQGVDVIFEDAFTDASFDVFSKKVNVNIDFEVTLGSPDVITFFAESNYYLNPDEDYSDYDVLDFYVTMVAEYSEITGLPIPTIDVEKKIELSKVVPEMTVGELVTAIKNWHNYDYTIEGDQMIFNKIQEHMDFEEVTSLEEFEMKSKPRGFQQGLSFLHKFADIEDSKFTYESVYHDVNGVQIQNYKTTKKTKEIVVNALPLPLDRIRNFETASAFENSDSKLYIVRYQGLTEGTNKTLSAEALFIPAIHNTNFFKWLQFRINAVSFKISFSAFNNQVKGLTSKSKIFMYNKLHYIKSIIKTQTSPDIVEVEIDSESFK